MSETTEDYDLNTEVLLHKMPNLFDQQYIPLCPLQWITIFLLPLPSTSSLIPDDPIMNIKSVKENEHLQLSFQLTVQPSVPSVFFQRSMLHSASLPSTFLLPVLYITQINNK